jgi:hypothetical protein
MEFIPKPNHEYIAEICSRSDRNNPEEYDCDRSAELWFDFDTFEFFVVEHFEFHIPARPQDYFRGELNLQHSIWKVAVYVQNEPSLRITIIGLLTNLLKKRSEPVE